MILQITITKWHRKFIVINSHNEGLEVWECNIILIKIAESTKLIACLNLATQENLTFSVYFQ